MGFGAMGPIVKAVFAGMAAANEILETIMRVPPIDSRNEGKKLEQPS